jgi:hypothetical protein
VGLGSVCVWGGSSGAVGVKGGEGMLALIGFSNIRLSALDEEENKLIFFKQIGGGG